MIKKTVLFIVAFSFVYFTSWYFLGEKLLFETAMKIIRKNIEVDEHGIFSKIIKDDELAVISKVRISANQFIVIPHEYSIQIPALNLRTIENEIQEEIFTQTIVRKTPVGGDSTKLVGFEIRIEENNGVLGVLEIAFIPYSDIAHPGHFIWAIFNWIQVS